MRGPRRVSIVISDSVSGETRDRCAGPADDGTCPRAAADGSLPCDGMTLLPLRGTDADGRRLPVGAHAPGACPLAFAVHTAADPRFRAAQRSPAQ